MRRGFLLLLCSVAAACGSAAPAPEYFYRLHLPPGPQTRPASQSQPAARFRLAVLSVSPALSGDRLQVAASDVRTESYATHRWAGPLELLLEESAARLLAPLAGSELDLPTLRLHVYEFFQVEGEVGWSGTASATAELLQGTKLIWREEFTATVPASARHPEAVVAALSRAWSQVLGAVAARATR